MTTAISGTITESLPPTDWIVRTSRLDTGAWLADTAVDTTSSGAYSASCGTYTGPVMAACYPNIGVRWSAAAPTALNSYAFPTGLSATPYFFKATTAPADAYFSSVKLLLHCNGGNGGTTFTDAIGHTVTPASTAVTSTAQKKFGTASCLLDGNSDYLTVADSADFELGGGDFTLEMWVFLTAYPGNTNGYGAMLIGKDAAGDRGIQFSVNATASSYTGLSFTGYDGSSFTNVTANAAVSLNAWHHVAVSRAGTLVYLFLDGALLNTGGTAFSRTIRDSGTALTLGKLGISGYEYYMPGYMDDVRITKGVGRYTAAFTAPSAAHPDSGLALTGASEPAWDTTTGNTTVDNQVTWTCMGPLIQPIAQGPLIPA